MIAPLQAEGYECIAAQYGLNTTAEDIALVKATIGRVSGPVILVGHSYGGGLIPRPGTHDPGVGLGYIFAPAPHAAETTPAHQTPLSTTDRSPHPSTLDG